MACSKKIIILLTFIVTLFCFVNPVRGEWTDSDINILQERLSAMESAIQVLVTYDLQTYNLLNNQLQNIKLQLDNANFNYQQINDELQQISQALYGSSYLDKKNFGFANGRSLQSNANGNYIVAGGDLWCYADYDNTKEYKLKITNSTGNAFTYQVALTIVNISNTVPADALLLFNTSIPAYTTYEYLIGSGYNQVKYLNFRAQASGLSIDLYQVSRNGGVLNNLQDINNNTNNINNSVNNVNNSINNDNIDVDSSTLPGDNTQDITDSGFNNIFQTIYNTFTTGTAQDLVINIPFTNKSFTINTSNVYGGANLGLVKILINSFWYFIISYFIVKDVGKKINKIKSGDIEHVQEDNIKEDLL